jgi:hypothetical protein
MTPSQVDLAAQPSSLPLDVSRSTFGIRPISSCPATHQGEKVNSMYVQTSMYVQLQELGFRDRAKKQVIHPSILSQVTGSPCYPTDKSHYPGLIRS